MSDSVSNPKSLGPAFNRLWFAFSSARLGDGLMAAAAPLLAISLTRDTVLIALSGAMYLLPWLFFAIAIGTLVDRIDRRRTLVAVAIVRALIAIALAAMIFTGTLSIYGLLLATFLIGTADVFNDTALQSLIPTILDKDKLERGNSRFQMSDTVLQQFIGMPLGAAFFVYSASLPFGLDALGFVIAAVMLVLIPRRHIAKVEVAHDRPSFKVQLVEGLRFLWKDKKIMRLVVATALIGFGFNIAGATAVLFLTETLGVPKALFGLLMLSGGIGGLLGAWASPKLSQRFGRGVVLAWSITLTSVFELCQGLSPNVFFFIVASIGAGFAIAGWNVLLMSVYHSLIPNEVFGRVHGTRRTLVWGIMPIGAYIGGLVAKLDLRAPYMVGGTFAILVAIVSFRFIRQLGNSSDNT
ncbi:MAG: MFS transporter [Rhodoluna sp.]|nr:MFS transporter [Rhodoluna sp.]